MEEEGEKTGEKGIAEGGDRKRREGRGGERRRDGREGRRRRRRKRGISSPRSFVKVGAYAFNNVHRTTGLSDHRVATEVRVRDREYFANLADRQRT